MADRLELEARFKDLASSGVRKLGKTLEGVRPSNGMQAAQKWMGDFRTAADKANIAVRPIASGLSAVGIGGLAASLSLAEIVKQFRDLADSTLTMKELGRQSRMSATDIARLQYAAGKLHVDPAAMSNAISSWSSQMVEFKMTTSEFYRYLMRQNADVAAKIKADSPVEALKDTLDYISHIKDPQIQKRVAEMAGVGELTPMTADTGKLKEAFADAVRNVKPITAEMQAAADRFNDATNRFNQTWTNLKNDIGPAVIDPLTGVINKLDEGLKLAAASPADAAAGAAIIAGSFAGFWLRARIMRGSKIMGGAGAAGEMAGAAREQVKAGTSLIEAAAALKEAAAELRGRGGSGAPGGPSEPSGPGGSSPGYRSLLPGALFFGMQAWQLADGMPEKLKQAETDNAPMDPQVGREAEWGDRLRKFFRGDAGPFHPDDDRLSRARPGDLRKDVQEGSKAGIIAGLRELAQQKDLEKKAGGLELGPGDGGGGRRGGGAGMPNLRYGRPSAGGQFRHGPGAQQGDSGGAFNARQPDKAGMYRPEYNLSAADLDDRVVNTIAGEAVTSNAESIDAVVNNMLNRIGSKGWGPSGNLLDVARAPGQYAGYRKADKATADRIRARIRAIASGGVPDNTNGSNAYRAAWYHGKWYRDHVSDGRVVGGNRFAYEPWTKNGPYAPYPKSKTDADAYAGRLKALKGSPPPGHASGGPIRGPGGARSDSIPAWLSNGEFVVNARASGQWLPFLHAINSGRMFADGGQVAAGAARRRSWLDFFHRPTKDGGMGAPWHVALGSTAMMMGESGRNLNPGLYGWDVNGPSGGTAQWHDVTTGRYAGKLHRLSDLAAMAVQQHVDWLRDVPVQQAWWKHEANGPLAGAWAAMRRAKTAAGTLKAGVDKFENPAHHDLEFVRRLPNIVTLARESGGGGRARVSHEIDPIQVDIRHHPHTGRPVATVRSGKGVKLGIRTAPTMRST